MDTCRCDGMVDVVDSKSTAGDSVPVRVRSPAPKKRTPTGGSLFWYPGGTDSNRSKCNSPVDCCRPLLQLQTIFTAACQAVRLVCVCTMPCACINTVYRIKLILSAILMERIARRSATVNGQDKRFAPLTAAARRAFWRTRRAGTACACPPPKYNKSLGASYGLCNILLTNAKKYVSMYTSIPIGRQKEWLKTSRALESIFAS